MNLAHHAQSLNERCSKRSKLCSQFSHANRLHGFANPVTLIALRRSEEFARACFPEITQARFRAPATELSARDKG
jgi:hypothetical protein